VQKFAAIKNFTVTIAFDHGDGNHFNPLISRESKFTIQAFTTPAHTPSALGCSRFENPAISVLAGGALHALINPI
jgi:hypothetical protein